MTACQYVRNRLLVTLMWGLITPPGFNGLSVRNTWFVPSISTTPDTGVGRNPPPAAISEREARLLEFVKPAGCAVRKLMS